MLVMIPISFSCYKKIKNYRTKVVYFKEYTKVKVKVDSFKIDITTGIREGEALDIYYKYNLLSKSLKVDEDAKDGNYEHFFGGRDSIYIWHNTNAKDIYTTKDSEPLDIDKFKNKMYFNLSLVVLTFLLVLWFIYIMFIEKNKNEEK